MAITSRQRRELLKFIKKLEPIKGRHTELVSVYIPAGYDMIKIIQQLAQEQGTASNIKDSTTRKNVTDSLERMIQHLRLFRKTPEHGLAVFSGNVAEKDGQQDIEVFSVEPPEPLNFRLYRCDKSFVLDALKEIAEKKDIYGLIVMDKREGDIALLKGKSIIPLTKSTSYVPGKTRAGGQSAARFERLREGAAKEFFSKLGEYVKEQFLYNKDLKGIIVGGPGLTKNEFVDGNYITDQVKRKIIAIKDLSYTGDFGLQELVDRSQDVLANEEIAKEKASMQRFFEMLSKKPKQVAYGEADVRKRLEEGAVDVVLLSETVPDEKIDEFEQIAERYSSRVEVISEETREGVQLRDMGKFAAVLRYEMH
ncbi:TPA: peptide chain release factor 1 [Candidatus Woesearchaeota archaeon]|nr:peptide chain release factor aRF-1 [Candidatus Woesearchaeota archaeon]HIH42000.1 peptide chain release factor 1 [Candidatus Woesearchaeota archaeon]